MKHTDGRSKSGAEKTSPLYTEKQLAKFKKENTPRDIDGAYRFANRKEDAQQVQEAA